VLAATPAELEFFNPERMQLKVGVTVRADGLPVYAPNITATVTTGTTGATGVISDVLANLTGSGFQFVLTANSRPGRYEVLIDAGPVRLVIPVRQRN
jgi:hypothetical protein